MCSHLWKVAQDMVIPCRIPDPLIPGTGADSPSMLAGEQLVSETPSNAQVKSELESTDESICIDDSIDESQWYAQGGADDLDETVKSDEGDAEDAAEDDAEYAAEDDAENAADAEDESRGVRGRDHATCSSDVASSSIDDDLDELFASRTRSSTHIYTHTSGDSSSARPVQQVAAVKFRAAYAAEAAARASRNISRKRTIDKIMEGKTVAETMEVIASHQPPKKAAQPPALCSELVDSQMPRGARGLADRLADGHRLASCSFEHCARPALTECAVCWRLVCPGHLLACSQCPRQFSVNCFCRARAWLSR